jgi:hypothetical protein
MRTGDAPLTMPAHRRPSRRPSPILRQNLSVWPSPNQPPWYPGWPAASGKIQGFLSDQPLKASDGHLRAHQPGIRDGKIHIGIIGDQFASGGAMIGAFGSGASGSSTISTRLYAAPGTVSQLRGGEMSFPWHVYVTGIVPLCSNAVDFRVMVPLDRFRRPRNEALKNAR